MKSIRVYVLIELVIFPILLHGVSIAQERGVYTNNNNYFAPNTVSAFVIEPSGKAVELPHSPFQTGGEGNGENGFVPANRIAVCNKLLFAANDFSANVSGFVINQHTGNLTPLPGSPFPTGEGEAYLGISIAITPNCRFVYAGNLNTGQIFAFRVNNNGTLSPVDGSPYYVINPPSTLTISANANLLVVGFGAAYQIATYAIGNEGELTFVDDVSLSVDFGAPGDIAINCDTSLLFVPGGYDEVAVFSIAANGKLSPIEGSPFTSPSSNSGSALNPNGDLLFTSNFSSGVSSFQVSTTGALVPVAGSPFNSELSSSSAVSIDRSGKFVYVADAGSTTTQFSVMKVSPTGSLSLAPNSPVSTGQDGGMFSLVGYPPMSCSAPN